jgi:hypothetical protein
VGDDAASVRAEWRAEEEEWSRAALEHWEHGRGLDDVLRDCLRRGDVATFSFPLLTWAGAVVGVGPDVVRIDVGDAPVDLQLTGDAPFVLRTRAATGAHRDAPREDTGGSTTFMARLRELDGTRVSIGTATTSLEGSLRVGQGQLRITDADGSVSYVPTGSVCWVRPLVAD